MNPSKPNAFPLGKLLIIDSIYLIDKGLFQYHLSSSVSVCRLYLFKELISPFYLDYQFMATELFIILLYYPFNRTIQGVMALFSFLILVICAFSHFSLVISLSILLLFIKSWCLDLLIFSIDCFWFHWYLLWFLLFIFICLACV